MAYRVTVSHLLLMHEGSSRSTATRSKKQARDEIAHLKSEIDDGADFADIAKENSDCPSSDDGGDLGAFTRGSMVKSFEKAAFDLSVGEMSEIVETEFGYHLIYRTK